MQGLSEDAGSISNGIPACRQPVGQLYREKGTPAGARPDIVLFIAVLPSGENLSIFCMMSVPGPWGLHTWSRDGLGRTGEHPAVKFLS